MEQFVNRETNNKRVMQVLDEDGNMDYGFQKLIENIFWYFD